VSGRWKRSRNERDDLPHYRAWLGHRWGSPSQHEWRCRPPARHRLALRDVHGQYPRLVCDSLIAGYFAFRGHASTTWLIFLTTGILGGFTTFSAFSLEAVLLYERGRLDLAGLYVVASVALSVGAVVLGLAIMRRFS
jgi:CrcB-like protein, Camphor Resistance (CrcB)